MAIEDFFTLSKPASPPPLPFPCMHKQITVSNLWSYFPIFFSFHVPAIFMIMNQFFVSIDWMTRSSEEFIMFWSFLVIIIHVKIIRNLKKASFLLTFKSGLFCLSWKQIKGTSTSSRFLAVVLIEIIFYQPFWSIIDPCHSISKVTNVDQNYLR